MPTKTRKPLTPEQRKHHAAEAASRFRAAAVILEAWTDPRAIAESARLAERGLEWLSDLRREGKGPEAGGPTSRP